jgi:L-alanine-DL-glutamate epimerase-like enolase superfamily enzyme
MAQPPDRLTWEAITLRLHTPFHLSYGVSDTRRAFWLRLAGDAGWGEAAIPSYYGISEADMVASWQATAARTDPLPNDPAEVPAWVGGEGPAPARCALDLALHDRIGRQLGLPLYELLDLPRPPAGITAFTISIATPDEMARQAAAAAAYPILKLKLGSDDDAARVAAVRAARPDVRLFVDANAAWTAQEAVQRLETLLTYELEMVEQPVPRDDVEGLGYVQAHIDVPVVADESVRTLADVERLAAAGVQGINLKLMKIGGLAPCLRMLRRGRELGLRIMLGCMVETAIGVTAMAHLAGLADWIDLDAPLLVSNDPFDGLRYDGAYIHMPDRPGIGVVRS